MTFDEVLTQALDLLRRQGRVSYRALKRRFDLDDEYIEDLKAEIIQAQRLAIDEDGAVLVWTGETAATAAPAQGTTATPLSYTPKHLAEKLLTSRAALEGERKQVTVLFADIKDSMAMLEDLDHTLPSFLALLGVAEPRALCQQIGETPQLLPVLWGLASFYAVRAAYQAAWEVGEQLLSLAHATPEPDLLEGAHWAVGSSRCFPGEFASAREHWEQGIALYDSQQHHHHVVLFGVDLGVFSRSLLSHTLWHLGYPDQALSMSHETLTLSQELSHPFSLALALAYVAMLHQFRREVYAARERAEAAIALCTKHGFAYYLAWATIIRGWAFTEQGQSDEGLAQMRQGLADLQATGGEIRLPFYLALLAEMYGKVGQNEGSITLLEEALAQARRKGEFWREAELYRLQGELLLAACEVRSAELSAEECLHQALRVARRQQAKSLELRAAMSLCRLWQQQGKRNAAHDMLAAIYGWFTEGFDTPDLQDA